MHRQLLLCNSTCWESAKAVLRCDTADAMLLQEHRLPPERLPGAQDWGRKAGWAVAATTALPGRKGSTCAGAAVAARVHVPQEAWPGLEPGEATLVPGRAAAVSLRFMGRGLVHVVSAYFKDNEGMGTINSALLAALEKEIKGLRGPGS